MHYQHSIIFDMLMVFWNGYLAYNEICLENHSSIKLCIIFMLMHENIWMPRLNCMDVMYLQITNTI